MEGWSTGFETLMQWHALLALLLGLVGGFVVGVLPGFGGANAAAIILPFGLGLSPESALLLIVGIYAGSAYGGAIPAILLNVPGTGGAAATALDGYPMARKGQGELAIGVARMASVCGGIIGTLIVMAIIMPLSTFALAFSPREMLAVVLFGTVIIASTVGADFLKGLMSAGLGLLIAAMPASPLTGQPRFALGFVGLLDAVPFIPAIIGLFAIPEMIYLTNAGQLLKPGASGDPKAGRKTRISGMLRRTLEGVKLTLHYPRTLVRGAIIGVLLGCVPGVGAAVANFVSYGAAKRSRGHKSDFGSGEPEGVVASESCDNASTAGTMVPTLTLGVPGGAVAAVMLGALHLHGIQPGPRLMFDNPGLTYSLLLGLLLSSILILPIGILLATPLTAIVRVPAPILVPSVLLLCMIGALAGRNSLFDVGVMIAFGLVGVVMRQTGFPVVPLVLGLILGPIAERSLMRGLTIGHSEWTYFFDSTIALVLWSALALTVVWSVWKAYDRTRGIRRQERGWVG